MKLWNCRLKFILEKWKKLNPEKLEDKSNIESKSSAPVLSSNSGNFKEMQPININKLSKDFKDFDDDYYEKAIKITTLELTHAQEISKKDLDLQIEKQKRARLVIGA